MVVGEAVEDLVGTADILLCIIVVAEVVGDAIKCYERIPMGGILPGQH